MISKFGYFEEILYDITYFVDWDSTGSKNVQEGLASLLHDARAELWREIRKYEAFEPERSVSVFQEEKSLQELLETLRQRMKTTIEGKFCWYNSERFTLDEEFAKYYSTFRSTAIDA